MSTPEYFLESAIAAKDSDNYTKALEYLVDYHTCVGKQRNLLEAESIKAYLENRIPDLNEAVSLDSIVESLATTHGGKYVITTHATIPGTPEHSDIVNVHVPDEISDHLDLGKFDEDRDYGKTDRITVANRETGDTAHFHIYPVDRYDGKTEYALRSIGNAEKPAHHWEHKNILHSYLKGSLNEDIDAIDSWKEKVSQAYPEHAGKIKFVSKENGKHISAEVPGTDRSFGVYDLHKNEGHVLEESYKVPEPKYYPAGTEDRKERLEGALRAVDELMGHLRKPSKPKEEIIKKDPEEKINENLKEVDGKWALVSKKDPNKVLQYYRGEGKPSDEWVSKVERRVHMFEQDETLDRSFLDLTEGFAETIKESIYNKLGEKVAAKIESLKKNG